MDEMIECLRFDSKPIGRVGKAGEFMDEGGQKLGTVSAGASDTRLITLLPLLSCLYEHSHN